jgi:hypothetical protein
MYMTAAEARAKGAFLRGPAALPAESGGAGGRVDRAADEAVGTYFVNPGGHHRPDPGR